LKIFSRTKIKLSHVAVLRENIDTLIYNATAAPHTEDIPAEPRLNKEHGV
jgi:hypothetical protein